MNSNIVLKITSLLDTPVEVPFFIKDYAIEWFSNPYLTWGLGKI
jgi:hypothetical protein